MKNLKLIILIFSISISCSQENLSDKYAESITSNELSDLLYEFASDKFEGRETGEPGQKLAVNFIRDFYKSNEIDKADKTEDYFQKLLVDVPGKMVTFPYSFPDSVRGFMMNEKEVNWIETENVAAIIKGSVHPDEYIIISAHLDHVGKRGDDIYNGADDDGSGSMALLELAQGFKLAESEGNGPKRSIVFLHVTGEEKGMLGSNYYTDQNPVFPLNQTIVNLNIDMIGRIDPKRKSTNRNYIYLIGSDKLSTDLHNLSEDVNKKYMNIELDYKFNDENDPNRFYYRSDHYNFAKNNIPVIFYFNGTHDDYHAISDTPDNIEYDLLEKRTRLVFLTAWEIANREKTITVDKDQ